jgi:hypothetical protein
LESSSENLVKQEAQVTIMDKLLRYFPMPL